MSGAHILQENGTKWTPSNNSFGCFGTKLEFGESGSGGIHLRVAVLFYNSLCSSISTYPSDVTSGYGDLMLLKYTGTGSYGGWAVCQEWPVSRATDDAPTWVTVARHVDTSVACGSGKYAAGFCAGPPGYPSLYWNNHSTYIRNCSDTYVNWVFSNGTHDF
jgi:hypothetical protein